MAATAAAGEGRRRRRWPEDSPRRGGSRSDAAAAAEKEIARRLTEAWGRWGHLSLVPRSRYAWAADCWARLSTPLSELDWTGGPAPSRAAVADVELLNRLVPLSQFHWEFYGVFHDIKYLHFCWHDNEKEEWSFMKCEESFITMKLIWDWP